MQSTFKIEDKFTVKNDVYILASIVGDISEYKLTENSTLGGIPIKPFLTIPRVTDKNGNPRFDLFGFCLKSKNDLEKVEIGKVVQLIF
ncbi:hypothetical protein V9L05_00760 [Bernardetia sp. Wsw4-3y2]|uniref:hypothetical protein n=1 Tax=unclassified Bernardetia TaxID=2647129 RepID=UPI0030CB227A